MTDLGMMTGKAALRLAKEESGLTRDEIAERLGVSHSACPARKEIEEEMVRAANAFEELRTLVNEDPPPSVRDMQHAVNRLILELGCIQEILSGHSLHRSRGALPLCPWWKFWKK